MGRPKRNLGPMDLRRHLEVLESAGRLRSAIEAGRLTGEDLKSMGRKKSLPYVMRMLRGDEAMNPDVLAALHRAVGLEAMGAPLDIWRGEPATLQAFVGPATATLLGALRALERGRAPCARLVLIERATAQVGTDSGPRPLGFGPQDFELRLEGFRKAWLLLMEYVTETRRWSSLQGLSAATAEDRTLDGENAFPGDKPIALRMNIIGPPGICEIVALVSAAPFDVDLFDMVPSAPESGRAAAVHHDALARHLAARAPSAPTLVTASFAYRV